MTSDGLDGLYDALLEPSLWPGALDAFAREVGAAGCLLVPTQPDLVPMPASASLEAFAHAFLEEGWYLRDHRASRGWPLALSGMQVVLEHDVASDEERRTLPYYHDLLGRFDLPWWAALAIDVNGTWWAASLLRDTQAGPYTREDAGRLEGLVPALRRLISLSGKLQRDRHATTLAGLDALSCAALLADRQGRLLAFNESASRLTAHALSLKDGCVVTKPASIGAVITRFVAEAAARPGAPRALRLALGGRTLVIEYFELQAALRDVFSCGSTLVTLTDIQRPGATPALVLSAALGLTRTEGVLTSHLSSGLSLEEAADRMGITRETARSHLKVCFSKTGVTRQGELVALALTLTSRAT
ncbi:MAG: helix-turn-helix transcriptional regulator [Alsobacter sp.]